MGIKETEEKSRTYYNCLKCPAFCCSVYDRVRVTKRDINRLAKYFGLTIEKATTRFTRVFGDERVLRRSSDPVLGRSCMFLDKKTRGCGIYHARPAVCREYPDRPRCAYYDLLQFERQQQDDPDVLPLVQITYKRWRKEG
jgi:uncharacterized protein